MQPLVSVIIRTCQRPEMLKNAIESIKMQTYKNIQIVIVEDGEATAESMIEKEYSDLNIKYRSTEKRKGRSAAGNLAMSLAEGEYFNFLDDDDILYEKHVETLMDHLVGREELAAYSIAEEQQVLLKDGIQKPKRKTVRFNQPFNRLLLFTSNYIPIQSILFHRKLYEEQGGLDENLDTLEDWDLWVRYCTCTNFVFVPQVTSCYNVPYKRTKKNTRGEDLRKNLDTIHQKFLQYRCSLSVEDINREMEYIIREYKTRGLLRYVRMFFRAIFFGER